MNPAEIDSFLMGLEDVQREENFGYVFYFAGDDRRWPFATIAESDNEYDKVSNLSREGVFRLNIGVSPSTFRRLTAGLTEERIDYTELNRFLPHPEYARQNFVCILNPAGENAEITKRLLAEAHGIAKERLRCKET